MANKSSLSYLGVLAPSPPDFIRVKRPPTTRDISNYNIGDLWLDESPLKVGDELTVNNLYMLMSKIAGEASWSNFTNAGLGFLTGDVGGAVGPDGAQNINILGTVDLISVTGNPGTNTLTLDLDDSVVNLFSTSSGSAISNNHELEFVDGTGISMSGVGNDITVSTTADIATTYAADAGTATPAAHTLNVLGGTNVDTSAAGSTVTVNLTGDVTTQFITDAGTAVPVNNEISIIGATNIDTAGAGNTVTINSTGTGTAHFTADLSAAVPNVTGAGTIYTILFNRIIDSLGGGFDITTGIYTAPSAGLYVFYSTVEVSNVSAAMTLGKLSFVAAGTGVSVGEWALFENNAGIVRAAGLNVWRFNGSFLANLNTGDQVSVITQFSNGAGNTAGIGIGSGVPPSRTWFSGVKVT